MDNSDSLQCCGVLFAGAVHLLITGEIGHGEEERPQKHRSRRAGQYRVAWTWPCAVHEGVSFLLCATLERVLKLCSVVFVTKFIEYERLYPLD